MPRCIGIAASVLVLASVDSARLLVAVVVNYDAGLGILRVSSNSARGAFGEFSCFLAIERESSSCGFARLVVVCHALSILSVGIQEGSDWVAFRKVRTRVVTLVVPANAAEVVVDLASNVRADFPFLGYRVALGISTAKTGLATRALLAVLGLAN